jgi:hypothetical protein
MKDGADGPKPVGDGICGKGAGACPALVQEGPPDPDLARIVAAWPELPEPIRRAVLALVAAAVRSMVEEAAPASDPGSLADGR